MSDSNIVNLPVALSENDYFGLLEDSTAVSCMQCERTGTVVDTTHTEKETRTEFVCPDCGVEDVWIQSQ